MDKKMFNPLFKPIDWSELIEEGSHFDDHLPLLVDFDKTEKDSKKDKEDSDVEIINLGSNKDDDDEEYLSANEIVKISVVIGEDLESRKEELNYISKHLKKNIAEVYFYHVQVEYDDTGIILGKLTNGIYFLLKYSCCSTGGFSCRGRMDFYFNTDPTDLYNFGLDNDNRRNINKPHRNR